MKRWRFILCEFCRRGRLGRAWPPPHGSIRSAGRRSARISKTRTSCSTATGKLLRAYATTEGRWRLPASVKDVDPRFLKMLFAYEDKRFYEHHGVDPAAHGARGLPIGTAEAYRLRRLAR